MEYSEQLKDLLLVAFGGAREDSEGPSTYSSASDTLVLDNWAAQFWMLGL